MTKDEALKLALEALEECHQLIYGDETKGGVSDYMDGYYGSCFDFVSNKNQINEAITATKNVLAQPNFCPRCGKRLGTNDWDIHTCTPPQRTWVGLDEDEFVYFCAYVNHEKLLEIENVLRDKNEQQTQ